MGTETYIDNLLKIIKKFNKKVIYIPHRAEVESIRSEISSIDNPLLTVLDVNKPVELYFLENKIAPKHIISYYSTALTTLGLIYDCEVNFIRIPENMSKEKDYDRILKIYYDLHKEYKIFDFKDL
jgi:hypothetical protein